MPCLPHWNLTIKVSDVEAISQARKWYMKEELLYSGNDTRRSGARAVYRVCMHLISPCNAVSMPSLPVAPFPLVHGTSSVTTMPVLCSVSRTVASMSWDCRHTRSSRLYQALSCSFLCRSWRCSKMVMTMIELPAGRLLLHHHLASTPAPSLVSSLSLSCTLCVIPAATISCFPRIFAYHVSRHRPRADRPVTAQADGPLHSVLQPDSLSITHSFLQ